MPKNTFKRHTDLLLIGEEGKRHYIFYLPYSSMIIHYIVEENIFAITVYKIFRNIKRSCYNDCFKINGKQTIKMPEKSEHVKIQKL